HKTLYFAGNVLFKTLNGGNSWQVISLDLSRESWDIPASVGIYKDSAVKKMARRGVIYTVAPSPLNINTIWAGTDDGLIYKTNDGGKKWKKIINGLPNDPINAVREDPEKRGLLFATSETQVYVSFDDGDNWQSLRLNMPATSVRDLIIKDNDLAVATHGRGFWILDDITSLRQINSNVAQHTILYKPAIATRVRWNNNTDTPLPPDEPAGQNPPDGAIIDYYLNAKANGAATFEIIDAKGNVV